MAYDHLIIGAGIAGSLLAIQLIRRERSVAVVREPDRPGATRIAAGLMNPITGRRYAPAWQLPRFLPYALQTYTDLQREFNMTFFHDEPILRLFQDDQDRMAWEQRRKEPAVQSFARQIEGSEWNEIPGDATFGGVLFRGGGFLQTGAMLDCLHRAIGNHGVLIEGRFEHDSVRVVEGDDLRLSDLSASVTFCEGLGVERNPYFSTLPFEFSQGDILTVRIESFPDRCLVCRGINLVPAGDATFRAGASYDWSSRDPAPTVRGRRWIETRLRGFLRTPFEVIDHAAGVRVNTRRRHPVAGLHPEHPACTILNRLGSKGVLYAPECARQLANLLVDGTPVYEPLDPKMHRPR